VALVVWVALAVSHVDVLNIPVARAVRWGMLGLLVVVSVLYAATARPPWTARLPWAVGLAAFAFCALATLSALWSVSPSLTLGRALTFDALVVSAAALAIGTNGSARAVGQILLALLAGATVVALGGVLALVVGDVRARQLATLGTPVRFNGLGGNPNTMALLLALALPLAGWALLAARSRPGKVAAVLAFLLLDLSIAASGSRGAILASFAGLAALALTIPATHRQRLAALLGSVALLGVNVGVTRIPDRADRNPVVNTEFGVLARIAEGDAQFILPLESEIGWRLHTTPRVRGFIESSGRLEAWRAGTRQAADRPGLGYGFGTEERVFVDRFYLFVADRVENSYLATALQLGIVGLVLLLLLLASVAAAGLRAVTSGPADARLVAAACAGVLVTGVALAVAQSFLTSVGSPPAALAWICAFLLAGLGAASAKPRARGEEGLRDEEQQQAA
jgi:O-Antigen ligase